MHHGPTSAIRMAVRLGYVYAYDRCAGQVLPLSYNNFGVVQPNRIRTFLHTSACHAAEAAIAESCYKAGRYAGWRAEAVY